MSLHYEPLRPIENSRRLDKPAKEVANEKGCGATQVSYWFREPRLNKAKVAAKKARKTGKL